jgi:hypothetical protein
MHARSRVPPTVFPPNITDAEFAVVALAAQDTAIPASSHQLCSWYAHGGTSNNGAIK